MEISQLTDQGTDDFIEIEDGIDVSETELDFRLFVTKFIQNMSMKIMIKDADISNMKARHKAVSQMMTNNKLVVAEIETILRELNIQDLFKNDRSSKAALIEAIMNLNNSLNY